MNTQSAGSNNPEAFADPRLRAYSILTRVAEGRRCVYRWLALGYYPPDAELTLALTTGLMAAQIASATSWLGSDQGRLTDDLNALRRHASRDFAEFSKEYDRLFGKSVERIAAREAAYRWRDVRDLVQASDAVSRTLRQEYRQFNVVPVPGQEDYVAV